MKRVSQFIDEVAKRNKLDNLKPDVKRSLRFKLGMADIRDNVEREDERLAEDIILTELGVKKASVRLASSPYAVTEVKVSPCPRCSAVMSPVKLATSREAKYCAGCHVVIPC